MRDQVLILLHTLKLCIYNSGWEDKVLYWTAGVNDQYKS